MKTNSRFLLMKFNKRINLSGILFCFVHYLKIEKTIRCILTYRKNRIAFKLQAGTFLLFSRSWCIK
ncbi:hypothetical protein D1164_22660 [Mariniphaga sediminis]|uniref:Uncharacterized protein n=1 Tax=Mariniphaga sediminis TaxID=1628158 RepID=A0A399CRX8_9BACT|nr:hypothetical protein D1164_22660 [Mariniphaga sediminis]